MSSYTIPGGRSKGTLLASADAETLKYWLVAKQKRLSENPAHQWAAEDTEWIIAAEAEIAARSGGRSVRPTSGVQPAKPRPLTREVLILAAIQGTAAYNTDAYEIARQAVAIADGILELTRGH